MKDILILHGLDYTDCLSTCFLPQVRDDWRCQKQDQSEGLLYYDFRDSGRLPGYGHAGQAGEWQEVVSTHSTFCYQYLDVFQTSDLMFASQAAGRHESLTSINMEKKAKWREEARREREAAAALADKAQW